VHLGKRGMGGVPKRESALHANSSKKRERADADVESAADCQREKTKSVGGKGKRHKRDGRTTNEKKGET